MGVTFKKKRDLCLSCLVESPRANTAAVVVCYFSFLGKDCIVLALQHKLLVHFIRKNATLLCPYFSNEFFTVRPI